MIVNSKDGLRLTAEYLMSVIKNFGFGNDSGPLSCKKGIPSLLQKIEKDFC